MKWWSLLVASSLAMSCRSTKHANQEAVAPATSAVQQASVQTGMESSSTLEIGFGDDASLSDFEPKFCVLLAAAVNSTGTNNLYSGVATEVLSLTTSSSTGHFFSDQLCTDVLSQPTVSAPVNSTNGSRIWYTDATPGSSVLSANDTGTLGLASQTMSIAFFQEPTQLVLNNVNSSPGMESTSAQPWSVPAETCTQIEVEAQDALAKYLTPTAAISVTLSTTGSGAALFNDAACTQPIDSTKINADQFGAQAEIYFQSQSAGTFTITALANEPVNLPAASVTINVTSIH